MDKKSLKMFVNGQGKKLEEERARLTRQIADLKAGDPFADPDHASDNAAIDTDVREQIGHETVEAEIKDFERRARNVEIALEKIEKGNYGVCERCGKPIPKPRLQLVPEARYCVDCEKALVR